jgi:uncharacterized glyoxalase superfamily protein PhnB
MPLRPQIIPNLRYHDAPAAIEFLCRAFGFVEHAVYRDAHDERIVSHAQLTYGGQMLMLSSAIDSDWARTAPLRTVRQAGGNTQTLYLVVDDVDAHAARARAAGAEIFLEPMDNDYGGRGYGARDPEGNAWSFGSYDPFED